MELPYYWTFCLHNLLYGLTDSWSHHILEIPCFGPQINSTYIHVWFKIEVYWSWSETVAQYLVSFSGDATYSLNLSAIVINDKYENTCLIKQWNIVLADFLCIPFRTPPLIVIKDWSSFNGFCALTKLVYAFF